MNMKPDCLVCLFNQTLRVTKALNLDDESAKKVLDEAAITISKFSLNMTPPEAAAILYPQISKIVKKDDVYEEKKIESTNKALKLLDIVVEKVNSLKDDIDGALRAAVLGNIIDFATQVMFDIEKEIDTIFKAKFAIDDKESFKKKLKESKKVVVIGDNVGEHVFDKFMMEIFFDFNPKIDIFYITRGKPIINDVTAKDAKAIDIDKIAQIVDSGVDTPGFIYNKANDYTKKIFDEADLILAKGMGNYECMEELKDDRIFFLFKVKCSVVANKIGKNIGDLICMNSRVKS
ncbi:damage-control phosphatase ARMT1 family protein [Nitrosophilus kaiyonis]|uniref:damage-control phosphatase ARMT1 family protein n=1 Tax=Nitrosophilus kaiyonis TaxID=2930200 RepID=UPI002493CAF2|nr:ARMT1-like domain-containing protein [Nitrosophilus kaiyonis]